MAGEIELASTLFSVLGTEAIQLINKLLDSKLLINKSATVYYNSSEIEYVFLITIGGQSSRTSEVVKTIQSVFTKAVKIEQVIEIYGIGLPHNEDLKELGIIRVSNNDAEIDFGRILREIKSDTLIIRVRKKFPEDLKKMLIVSHVDQTFKHYDDKLIEANISVSLDYANLWHKIFDEFTVRDIESVFTLEVSIITIVQQIPQYYRNKIIKAAAAISSNKDAIQFLKILSDSFLTFEDEKRIQQLLDCVSVEPIDRFQIKTVVPSMQSMEIANVGYPVVLPGKLKIILAFRLEGKDIAMSGKLKIDLQKFVKILSSILTDIQKKTTNLKF